MQRVRLSDASHQLPELIDAAMRGEVILIATDEHHEVQLVPLPQHYQSRRFGSARGLLTISPDFDAPLDDFREYVA
jgi:antitoxin (DNA-binding transcriptional repressor) of toxin-antitoxin stability system